MRHRIFAAVLALALPSAASAVTVQGSWSLGGDALTGAQVHLRPVLDDPPALVELPVDNDSCSP